MNEKTKLSLILLFPPFLLWFFVLLLAIDKTLGAYIFERVSSQTIGIIMVITGFLFPGTALFISISNIVLKEDAKLNLVLSILCTLLISLFVGFMYLN